jgi:hypothetical protein
MSTGIMCNALLPGLYLALGCIEPSEFPKIQVYDFSFKKIKKKILFLYTREGLAKRSFSNFQPTSTCQPLRISNPEDPP